MFVSVGDFVVTHMKTLMKIWFLFLNSWSFLSVYVLYSKPFTDETKKSGKRLVGDVEFAEAKKRASWITPVPGGKFNQYLAF